MSASRSESDRPTLLLRVLAVLAVGAACAPLLAPGYVGGHEGPAYLFRAAEFSGQLAQGEIRPRWCPHFYWGYGYPFFVYYPPGVFYAAAALQALGLSVAAALEAVTALGWVLFFFGVRRLTRCWTGEAAAWTAAIAASVAIYRVEQIYARGDVAESVGTALLPWLLAEFVLLVRPRSSEHRVTIAARAGALLGLVFYVHTLTAVAACMSVGVLGLAASVRGGPMATLRAAGAGALGVLLGAAYWIPAKLGQPAVRTEQMLDRVPGEFSWWYGDHFVAWWQRFDPRVTFGDSVPGIGDTLSFGTNPVVWLAVLTVSVLVVRDLELRRRSVGPLAAMALANGMMLEVARPIWNVAPLLPWFQFPWRILLVEGLAAAVLVGLLVDRRGTHRPRVAALTAGLVLAAAGPGLSAAWNHADTAAVRLMPDQARALDHPETIDTIGIHHRGGVGYTVTTAARNEYLPRSVSIAPTSHPDAPGRVRPERDLGHPVEEQGSWRRWVVRVTEPGTYEVAWFAFPGLRAERNGEPLPFAAPDPYGLVRFDLPEGVQTIDVWYARPPRQPVANAATALGLFVLLIMFRRGASTGRARP